MEQVRQTIIKRAYRFLMLQTAFVAIIALTVLLMGNSHVALSSLTAGLICIVANAAFIGRFFASTGAKASKEIVKGFYRGETRKILITVLLFILAFKFLSLSYVAFFITYVATQMTFWLVPFVMSGDPLTQSSSGQEQLS